MNTKTADINKTINFLCKTYPSVFSIDSPKPLSIGIHLSIKKRHSEDETPRIEASVAKYVGRIAYLTALCKEKYRIDIQGKLKDVITDKDRQYAKTRILHLQVKYSLKNARKKRAKEENKIAMARKTTKVEAEKAQRKTHNKSQKALIGPTETQQHLLTTPLSNHSLKNKNPKILFKKRRKVTFKPK